MASTTYDVVVNYLSRGDLSQGLAGLQGQASALESRFGSAASSVAGSFNSAFDSVGLNMLETIGGAALTAGAAVTAAISEAVKAGFEQANFLEQSRIGVAAVSSMISGTSLDEGVRAADASVERLRVLAKELPGTLRQVMGSFQSLQPIGESMGLPLERIEKLAAHGVAAAAAVGVNQSVAGHELAAMLEGRASSRMPMVSKLGFHSKELNAMTPMQRVEAVESKFGKLDGAIELYKHSMAGLWSNAVDSSQQVAKHFADPLRGSVMVALDKGLTWFGANEDRVTAVATALGEHLRYAFDSGLDFIERWYGPVTAFGRQLYSQIHDAFEAAAPWLEKFADVAERFLKDPKALDHLESAAKGLLALRAGTGALSLGSGAVSSLGEGGGIAALGGEALLAAPAIALFGAAVFGAVDTLTNKSNELHDASTSLASGAADHASKFAASGARIVEAARPLSDLLGVALLGAVNIVAANLEGLASALEMVGKSASAIGGVLDVSKYFLHRAPDDPRTHDPLGGMRLPDQHELFHPLIDTLERYSDAGQGKVPHHTTIVQKGAIQLNVSGSSDPNRVAKKVSEILTDALTRPLSSAHDPRTPLYGR